MRKSWFLGVCGSLFRRVRVHETLSLGEVAHSLHLGTTIAIESVITVSRLGGLADLGRGRRILRCFGRPSGTLVWAHVHPTRLQVAGRPNRLAVPELGSCHVPTALAVADLGFHSSSMGFIPNVRPYPAQVPPKTLEGCTRRESL
jgi:hypothetical protein